MATESVLITATRLPAALELIRGFDEAGLTVYGEDSIHLASGSHSRHLAGHVEPTRPSEDPVRFAAEVADYVRANGIDLIVPGFEEIFYLARHASVIPATLFAPPFETLARLHDKARFWALASELGLETPRTTIVRDRDELRAAIADTGDFVARPAFSRGGLVFLTNVGGRAAERSVDECTPTDENPWLVQEYVDGHDVCTYSVAHDGALASHCSYDATIQGPGGYSIQFRTIEDFGGHEIASTIAAELAITGSLGFDFRIRDGRPLLLECNPRCTSGVVLTGRPAMVKAILDPSDTTHIVPAGVLSQIDLGLLVPSMNTVGFRRSLKELVKVSDPEFSIHDVLPAAFYLATLVKYSKVAKREHVEFATALIEDIAWDGAPIPGPVEASTPAGPVTA